MTNKKDNKKVYEEPLHLDMDFGEAMRKFGQTDSKELPDKFKLSQKKKDKEKEPPDKSSDPD